MVGGNLVLFAPWAKLINAALASHPNKLIAVSFESPKFKSLRTHLYSSSVFLDPEQPHLSQLSSP